MSHTNKAFMAHHQEYRQRSSPTYHSESWRLPPSCSHESDFRDRPLPSDENARAFYQPLPDGRSTSPLRHIIFPEGCDDEYRFGKRKSSYQFARRWPHATTSRRRRSAGAYMASSGAGRRGGRRAAGASLTRITSNSAGSRLVAAPWRCAGGGRRSAPRCGACAVAPPPPTCADGHAAADLPAPPFVVVAEVEQRHLPRPMLDACPAERQSSRPSSGSRHLDSTQTAPLGQHSGVRPVATGPAICYPGRR